MTEFPCPKLEGNSRHATQQPETHDHQWWLDVSVVRRVSSSKQTKDNDVLVHQPSTKVFCSNRTDDEEVNSIGYARVYKFSIFILRSGFASISGTTSGKNEVDMSTPVHTGDD